jgi:hypothetical protein
MPFGTMEGIGKNQPHKAKVPSRMANQPAAGETRERGSPATSTAGAAMADFPSPPNGFSAFKLPV